MKGSTMLRYLKCFGNRKEAVELTLCSLREGGAGKVEEMRGIVILSYSRVLSRKMPALLSILIRSLWLLLGQELRKQLGS